MSAFAATQAQTGLDIACINAGAVLPLQDVADTTAAQWDWINGVNLRGAYLIARAVTPLMRARGGGAIVFTASIASFRGHGGSAAYATTKGGPGRAEPQSRHGGGAMGHSGQHGLPGRNRLTDGWHGRGVAAISPALPPRQNRRTRRTSPPRSASWHQTMRGNHRRRSGRRRGRLGGNPSARGDAGGLADGADARRLTGLADEQGGS